MNPEEVMADEIGVKSEPQHIIKRNEYRDKECKVLKYDKNKNLLDILFDKYGMRLTCTNFNGGETVIVKYKGEIGSPNFKVVV